MRGERERERECVCTRVYLCILAFVFVRERELSVAVIKQGAEGVDGSSVSQTPACVCVLPTTALWSAPVLQAKDG